MPVYCYITLLTLPQCKINIGTICHINHHPEKIEINSTTTAIFPSQIWSDLVPEDLSYRFVPFSNQENIVIRITTRTTSKHTQLSQKKYCYCTLSRATAYSWLHLMLFPLLDDTRVTQNILLNKRCIWPQRHY